MPSLIHGLVGFPTGRSVDRKPLLLGDRLVERGLDWDAGETGRGLEAGARAAVLIELAELGAGAFGFHGAEQVFPGHGTD